MYYLLLLSLDLYPLCQVLKLTCLLLIWFMNVFVNTLKLLFPYIEKTAAQLLECQSVCYCHAMCESLKCKVVIETSLTRLDKINMSLKTPKSCCLFKVHPEALSVNKDPVRS